jgi:DNA-binding NtrC family response regulator
MDFSKLRVLVVDDDQKISLVIVRFLKVLGFLVENIIVKTSTKEGWDYLKSDELLPSVIFTDFRTEEEGKNGYTFLQQIYEEFVGLPVVLMSGGHDLSPEQIGEFSAFLSKPYGLKDLKIIIQKIFS